MAGDIVKALFLASLAGDSGHIAADEIRRQAEIDRERADQAAHSEERRRLCEKSQEQRREDARRDHIASIRREVEAFQEETRRVLKDVAGASRSDDREDPRYRVNRFPPAKLYGEYLAMGSGLKEGSFCLPPSWLNEIPKCLNIDRCREAEEIASLRFSAGDLCNLPNLAEMLRQPWRAFDAWFAAHLSPATQTLLAKVNYQSQDSDLAALQEALVQDFNEILKGTLIYDQERFADIALRRKTQKLMSQKPQEIALERLNRLLIEDAYPSVVTSCREIPPSCLIVCSDRVAAKEVAVLLQAQAAKFCVTVKEASDGSVQTSGDVAGLLANLEEGDFLIMTGDSTPAWRDVYDYFQPAIQDFKVDIIIDQGPTARSVRLNLPQFSMYWITTCTTKQTNRLSAIFPQEIVIANLVQIHTTALIGQLCKKRGIDLSYNLARQILFLSGYLCYAPIAFLDILPAEHPDWIEDLRTEKVSMEDWCNRFEKEYGVTRVRSMGVAEPELGDG